jgi:hypothetical protein
LRAAASDVGDVRRIGEHNADELLGAEVILASEVEAVAEVADELERMLAGGGA